MKHCPNPNCPFLAQMDMVAEFHDPIEFCADCGTALVPWRSTRCRAATCYFQPKR